MERSELPQVSIDDIDLFLEYLSDEGIKYSRVLVKMADLIPTQSEFNIDKVLALITKKSPYPCIVSQDLEILDGHHRWMGCLLAGVSEREAIQVYLPIDELIEVAWEFPMSFAKELHEDTTSVAIGASLGPVERGSGGFDQSWLTDLSANKKNFLEWADSVGMSREDAMTLFNSLAQLLGV